MDTLTVLMQILGAIVEGAKLVTAIVAFVLLSVFCKNLPLKLRKFIPHLAATAFMLNVAGANCEQYCTFLALCWNRLGSVILSLSGSMTMILILFTIVLVSAIVGYKTNLQYLNLSFGDFHNERGLARKKGGTLFNSFLAMTPVLLS